MGNPTEGVTQTGMPPPSRPGAGVTPLEPTEEVLTSSPPWHVPHAGGFECPWHFLFVTAYSFLQGDPPNRARSPPHATWARLCGEGARAARRWWLCAAPDEGGTAATFPSCPLATPMEAGAPRSPGTRPGARGHVQGWASGAGGRRRAGGGAGRGSEGENRRSQRPHDPT